MYRDELIAEWERKAVQHDLNLMPVTAEEYRQKAKRLREAPVHQQPISSRFTTARSR